MTWKPGQKLQRGKYTIEKVLGQGGFGITYLVKDKQGNPWQVWCNFGDRVGWRMKGNWVAHNRLNFTANAPVGELPSLVVADSFALRQEESVVSLLSRNDL